MAPATPLFFFKDAGPQMAITKDMNQSSISLGTSKQFSNLETFSKNGSSIGMDNSLLVLFLCLMGIWKSMVKIEDSDVESWLWSGEQNHDVSPDDVNPLWLSNLFSVGCGPDLRNQSRLKFFGLLKVDTFDGSAIRRSSYYGKNLPF